MAWIGGIFSKVHATRDELKEKLAVMMEAACPPNGHSTPTYPPCISSIFDDVDGQALARLSIPIEGTPPEYIHTDYRQRPVLIYDGHLYSLESARSKLSRIQHRVNETPADSLAHLLGELPGNLEQKVRRALISLDGDYALAVSGTDQMLIARDRLGTKPLYFAESEDLSVFASNKKPLWKIGLGEIKTLRAGMLAILNHEGVSVRRASPLRKRSVEMNSMARAVNTYEKAFRSAMTKRLGAMNHARKVGVLLSGGVDSCLIAKMLHDIASNMGMEMIAYSVGLPESPDLDFAREFAGELSIKHRMKILSLDMVKEYIPKVIEAIEDSDFVQVETGIGLYAALEMASHDGVTGVLSGQGPDELWGGYSWYPKVLGKDGRQELCSRMREDFTRVDIETLDRENKIAMAHGVELFFPYLDTEVVNVAMSVASELKVTSEEDRLGKHPHRQLATKMGISEKYANREKLAIQHGAGIHGVLDDIARSDGFDPSLVKEIGYKSDEITIEKLGSSARYGYRYIDKRLWQVPQHVQLFLHALAYRKGLLDISVRDRVGYFVEKARLSAGEQA
jgi:asparagine synthase (glutamine-hydrolysing)